MVVPSSIIVLFAGLFVIGVYFVFRSYQSGKDERRESKFVKSDNDLLDDILEAEMEEKKEKKEEKEEKTEPPVEKEYDEVHKDGKLSVFRKKKENKKYIDLASSDEEEENYGQKRTRNEKKAGKPPKNRALTPENEFDLEIEDKIDHSYWNDKFSKEMRKLEKRGFRDATRERNISKDYFLYNSLSTPYDRFHYQTFYSSEEKKLIALVYFGTCVLGPGSVHGGAILGLTLEMMKIFLRTHGLGKLEMIDTYGCMFMAPVPLDTVHKIEVEVERVRKNGNYEVKAEIKSFDQKVLYFIGRGEFNESDTGMDVISEEEEGEKEERKSLQGVTEMKKSFMELVKFENYKHIKNYREYHKYLQYETHFLNFDQKEGMTMSNYFNFKVLLKVEDLEAIYFVFFGKKTEGERKGFVHPSALAALFDALAGLTPILMGYSNVKTNSLNIDFQSEDVMGGQVEVLRLYKLITRNRVLRKDVLKDKNMVRTKHRVTSRLQDITGHRVYAMFTGVFVDFSVL